MREFIEPMVTLTANVDRIILSIINSAQLKHETFLGTQFLSTYQTHYIAIMLCQFM